MWQCSLVSGELPARILGKVILWDGVVVGGATASGDSDQWRARAHGGAGVRGHLHGERWMADHLSLGDGVIYY